MKNVNLREIITFLADEFLGSQGPVDRTIEGVAAIDVAGKNQLTFSRSVSASFSAALHDGGPDAIIIANEMVAIADIRADLTLIRCRNPRLAFLRVVKEFFAPKPTFQGVHKTAVIEEGVVIDPTATIGPFVYIASGSSVGAGTVIYPNVAIYCPTQIGKNAKIHAGTVIGADGFGYERNADGELEGFPHLGGVVIEDEAEIGANTCIDRGTLGNTFIGSGARVDNLVHVAHNVQIGARSAVIANAMLGGSVDIGEEAWIAPSATIMNKRKIGRRATVGLGALVVKDVADGEVVMGSPAMPQEKFRQLQLGLKLIAMPDIARK